MASCRKWILNIHSFTIWIKNEQLPVDRTFWWPILRKKFHEIFTLVWEAISKTRASGFIRRSKHLETIKALGRSGLVLSSVSRCLEPLIKPSHSLLIYYFKHGCKFVNLHIDKATNTRGEKILWKFSLNGGDLVFWFTFDLSVDFRPKMALTLEIFIRPNAHFT